ncbi:MAG: M15 family metallopeptidase [Fusobacteriaceae bacterium]|jgi:peptidoglycan L-alanyl-D-glutamate endopeptidase CwlK|nr:M15 family metallopeptidase [Fusobacteriaceae bacterium]
MAYKFGKRSTENLKNVDARLVKIMLESIQDSPYDFIITEGLRSLERQKQLKKEGKSQTLKSYHLDNPKTPNIIDAMAVDIMVYDKNNKVTWDFKYYKEVADHIKKIVKKLGYKITWGGDWKTFKDGPHFQLED